jgi:hypothetical protein
MFEKGLEQGKGGQRKLSDMSLVRERELWL